MPGKAKGGKKAVKSVKKAAAKPKDWKSQHAHLFKDTKRDFRIGQDVLPAKRDLSRYVKWPRYVRLQRQRAILKQRLKVPPAIHQFSRTVDKNQASTLFRLLAAYRPESVKEKKERLVKRAAAEVKGQAAAAQPKPKVLKFGVNHVVSLVERKLAKLVVIAHDVDPIEMVVYLPALCRKMDVPYCIVKGKGRLGHLVYQKNATCVALTDINKEDNNRLNMLVDNLRLMYNDSTEHNKWSQRVLGVKSTAMLAGRAAEAARSASKSSKLY